MAEYENIQAEIAGALDEVGRVLGTGPLNGFILRAGVRDDSTYPPTRGPGQRILIQFMYDELNLADEAQSLIPESDMLLLVAATGPVPQSTDRLELEDGRDHEVVRVKPFQPGGQPLYYTVQVKR